MAEPIATSTTSERSNTQGKECKVGRPLTAAEGWKVIDSAKEWEGTPYAAVGGRSERDVKGDCSGTTNKIYEDAGFPYVYQSTGAFQRYAEDTRQFSKLTDKDTPQAGDILLWSGHMAIYAPFPDGDPRQDTGVVKHGVKQKNDMYTAFRTGGSAYGPYKSSVFRADAYTVWRYNMLPGKECPGAP